MRRVILFLFAALAVTSVDAASYVQTDGTIVDPILDIYGNVLAYSGSNLESIAQLQHASLSHANLTDADLGFATLTGADLDFASLYRANLGSANLTSANLTSANLSSATLPHASLSHANLTDADLYYANLTSATLTSANLTHADLLGANLTNANLHYADCTGADFTGAILTFANFTGATDPPSTSSQLALTPLDEMIIGGAQLHYANFSRADISGVNFTSPPPDPLDATGWETATWTDASFHYLNQPLFPTGMIYTDHGIVVRTPEPASLLLALFGLALLPRKRRR